MCTASTGRRLIPLGFSDEQVLEGQHICYIYNEDAERRRVLAKYLESGILAGEKVMYLADELTPEEMLDAMEELGVDVRSKPDRFSVGIAADTYCPKGAFSADDMLEVVRSFYDGAVGQGFVGARSSGEMSWCLVEGRADLESLMDYEVRLSDVVARHPHTACCQYDARRFDGAMLMDVLSVHPVMIVRGQLVRNPYYVEPGVFVREFRARTATRG